MEGARTYRAVMLMRKGGPEMLEVVDLPVREPARGELRVRVRAAGVGSTDVSMLSGRPDSLRPRGVRDRELRMADSQRLSDHSASVRLVCAFWNLRDCRRRDSRNLRLPDDARRPTGLQGPAR